MNIICSWQYEGKYLFHFNGLLLNSLKEEWLLLFA